MGLLWEDSLASAREAAASALWLLTNSPRAQSLVSAAGGIGPLVALCREGNTLNARTQAARCLWRCAVNNTSVQLEVLKAGAPIALCSLLTAAEVAVDDPASEAAAAAVWALAGHSTAAKALFDAGAVGLLTSLLKADDPAGNGAAKAAWALRNMAQDPDVRVAIAAGGAIPPLIVVILRGSPEGKEGAARALRALCAAPGDAAARVEAALHGAVSAVAGLLSTPTSNAKLREAAAATIAALGCRDVLQVALAEAGVVPHLVSLLQRGTADGKDAAVSALCALSWHADVAVLIDRAGALPAITKWLLSRKASPAGAAACAGALDNLTLTNGDARNAVASTAGAIECLVEMELAPESETPPPPEDVADIRACADAAAACLRNLASVSAHAKVIEAERAKRRENAVQSEAAKFAALQLVTPRRGAALVASTVALLLDAPLTGAAFALGAVAAATPAAKSMLLKELGPHYAKIQAFLGIGKAARRVVNPFPQYGRLQAT